MATATKEPVGPPPPMAVVLRMTEEEAEALLAVLRLVGGIPIDTRRGLVENIHDSLLDAEVNYDCEDLTGGIYFK